MLKILYIKTYDIIFSIMFVFLIVFILSVFFYWGEYKVEASLRLKFSPKLWEIFAFVLLLLHFILSEIIHSELPLLLLAFILWLFKKIIVVIRV